ncbi:hypothetical protein [Paractinoplanes lichenicola]|uniref:Uncharacterized protein n=1 Tax=Paractinoplanes lichenicola TaxID=2802976 RepID=A0ABS1VN25_9ACTN|nr:hypothetical protein [Actinoplanes lichenicola]MBL7255876.1 hypothetical protein [Actinoplanes lichenicola]
MSMELLLVKLTPEQAEAVSANPEVLNELFDDPDDLPPPLSALDDEADLLELNYLHVSEYLDTEADESAWMRKAVDGAGTKLDVDLGYETAWLIGPAEVREITAGIEQDGWFDPDPHMSGDLQALATFFRTAAEQGRAVAGGIG